MLEYSTTQKESTVSLKNKIWLNELECRKIFIWIACRSSFLMKIFRWKLVFDSQAMLFTALYNMVNELSLFTVQMNFGASFFQKIRVVKA